MVNIIANLMKERGLSQTDVANGAGLGQSTVSDILSGAKRTSENSLRKLANYFDVSIDYLLGIEKSPNALTSGLSPIDAEIMSLIIQAEPEIKNLILQALRSKLKN